MDLADLPKLCRVKIGFVLLIVHCLTRAFNLQFVMQLGCFMMRLTPVEVLNAVTINAAYSVNRQDKIGSFDTGKQADITILDAKNIDYPLYFFATNLTHQVYKAGKLVVDQGRIV